MNRFAITALVVVSGFVASAPARAAVPSVFGGAVPCQAEADGVRFCGGPDTTVPTFDGVPIDVNVALPPAASDGDGNYPLIMLFHGWGGSEYELSAMRRFVSRGYAVFSMSDRGWGGSCGGQTSKTGACAQGHNRLMDTRYEVRDAQYFAGLLADEGLIDPKRIGAIGGSYGGGISMALAALRDRVAVGADPATGDLILEPWRSPRKGLRMRLAAATPDIPWTDLAYSLVPNGRTLDYVADAPYSLDPDDPVPGVMKLSFVSGLFAIGAATSNYALPGTDPDADLFSWYASIVAGEPYAQNPVVLDAMDELTKHHSSYYIDSSQPPAPLLISNGFTDDIFPADEALRFYNRTRTEHRKARISLVFMDHGHQRGQNKPEDLAYLRSRQDEWLDYYVKGTGDEPSQGVTVKTQRCGGPSEGPFSARTWRELSPGEVRLTASEQQRVLPVPAEQLAPVTDLVGEDLSAPAPPDLVAGLAYDPIAGSAVAGGACAAPPRIEGLEQATTDIPGATYELEVTGDGFLMAGSPTVVADLLSAGPSSQVASRLIDVAPDGSKTLVARGLYRADSTLAPKRQVFQLHPNAYRFEPGHRLRLELLPMDAPYGRPSNLQAPITFANLELRVPTRDRPDGGQVREPAPKFVPKGYTLAVDYRAKGKDGTTKGRRAKQRRSRQSRP